MTWPEIYPPPLNRLQALGLDESEQPATVTQDPDLNSFLVAELLDLRAVESASVIEQAFTADRIDFSISGDWEDVQVELGLLPARLTPPPRYTFPRLGLPRLERAEPAKRSQSTRARRAAEKRRKKIAKQSKRRNRRRR